MKMESRVILVLGVTAFCCAAFFESAAAKTAKDCTAEWRADKAGMQARGMTEKAYVDQCKTADERGPAATPKTTTTAPAPAAKQTTDSGQKTAKQCTEEWRADKAGMQARGTTEKTYVDQCKAGGTAAATPASKPTVAAPAPAPAPSAATAAPQKTAPVVTTKPTTTSALAKPAASNETSLEAGQFATEAQAKGHCATDIVVWVNLSSKIYHFSGGKVYGNTKRGAYICEKDALKADFRAAKNEKRPG